MSTLLATFVGALLAAAVGVWLFNYQSSRNDERRSQQLLASLAAELHATIDFLESKPLTRVLPPEGCEEEAVEVVVTSLEPTACEESIRSAVLTPQDVFNLTHLARVMRSYTLEANLLESIITGPRTDSGVARRTYEVAQDVKNFQSSVLEYCRTITAGLEEEGIEMPSKTRHYSENSEVSKEQDQHTDSS